MRAIRQIFTKRTARTVFGFTTGIGLGFGLYQLGHQIQASLSERPRFDQPQQLPIQQQPPIPKAQQQQEEKSNPQIQPQKEELSEQPVEQPKEKEEEILVQKQRRVFKDLREVSQFGIGEVPQTSARILIVADLPYNKQFEDKILQQVNTLTSIFPDLQVFRRDLSDPKTAQHFKINFKANIKDQTLFLLKNPYEKGLSNIDFDIFVQFPQLLTTYLKDVKPSETEEVRNNLTTLSPHQSCLLYLYDKEEGEQKVRQRMLASKYIQMEMAVNNITGINVAVVDKKQAVQAGLVDSTTARSNSLHLFRPYNIYTPNEPNYYLQVNSKSLPFHRLADIALFAKGSHQLMLTHYLAGLQTFDAIANPAPYLCTLRVDRNRISEEEYNQLMKIFGQLRVSNAYPDVAFALKLKSIPYAGQKALINKQWQITLSNVEELDREAMMHEIKTEEQRKTLGYQEDTYLKTTHQYLYPHNVINPPLIQEFIQNALKGQLPKYYKSEESHPLSPVSPLSGSQFQQKILDDDKDHFLYEYSGFCPTCKKVSPIIGAFARVVQEKGLGLNNLEFHKLDANKNRVKGQLGSPFIPNIYYYKAAWKKQGPVRFPIESLGTQGLSSLYVFCAITNQLQNIDWQHIQHAIEQQQRFKEEIRQFV